MSDEELEDNSFFSDFSVDSDISNHSNSNLYVIDPVLLSVLMRACYENDVEFVNQSLSEGNEAVKLLDKRGYSALHYAAESGSVEVLKLLLNQPLINVDIRIIHTNETPLHRAVVNCKVEAVDMLVKKGANVNLVNCYNESPLLYLICRGYTDLKLPIEMGQILLNNTCVDRYQIFEVLSFAVKLYDSVLNTDGYADWLNFLCMFIYYGADINTCYKRCVNTFALALTYRCDDFCNIMLPYVVDFDVIVYRDKSILFCAIENKSPDVFYMIEQGADINFSNGKSCLELSLKHSVKLFEYMLEHCDDETILYGTDFFKALLRTEFEPDEFIRCANLIFQHKFAAEIFSALSVERQIHYNFILKMISLNVSVEDQIKFLYSLLMYNNELMFSELHVIFHIFRFDERFEAYLCVTVTIKNNLSTFGEADNIFACMCFPNMFHLKTKSFPSLLALSRNCIRSNICQNLICDKNCILFKYYNRLLQLNVPKSVVDILTLKKLL